MSDVFLSSAYDRGYHHGMVDERARIRARLAEHHPITISRWHAFCNCGWTWDGNCAVESHESKGAWLDHALGVEATCV